MKKLTPAGIITAIAVTAWLTAFGTGLYVVYLGIRVLHKVLAS